MVLSGGVLMQNFCDFSASRPLPHLSIPSHLWPHGWDFAGERARPGGRFRRRAASPENSPAIHGWDSMPAIVQSPARDERSLRMATIFSAVPAGLFHFVDG